MIAEDNHSTIRRVYSNSDHVSECRLPIDSKIIRLRVWTARSRDKFLLNQSHSESAVYLKKCRLYFWHSFAPTETRSARGGWQWQKFVCPTRLNPLVYRAQLLQNNCGPTRFAERALLSKWQHCGRVDKTDVQLPRPTRCMLSFVLRAADYGIRIRLEEPLRRLHRFLDLCSSLQMPRRSWGLGQRLTLFRLHCTRDPTFYWQNSSKEQHMNKHFKREC